MRVSALSAAAIGLFLLFAACGGNGSEDVVGRQTGSRQAPEVTATAAPTPAGTAAPGSDQDQPSSGSSAEQQAPAGSTSGGDTTQSTPEPTDAPDYPEETSGPGAPDIPGPPGPPGY